MVILNGQKGKSRSGVSSPYSTQLGLGPSRGEDEGKEAVPVNSSLLSPKGRRYLEGYLEQGCTEPLARDVCRYRHARSRFFRKSQKSKVATEGGRTTTMTAILGANRSSQEESVAVLS